MNLIPNNQHPLSKTGNFVQELNAALQLPVKSRPYTAYITRHTPSAFVFLLDQSGSMDSKLSLPNGNFEQKSVFLANAINDILNQILDRCIKGTEIRDYFDIAIIGYGGQESETANFAWEGNLSTKT